MRTRTYTTRMYLNRLTYHSILSILQ